MLSERNLPLEKSRSPTLLVALAFLASPRAMSDDEATPKRTPFAAKRKDTEEAGAERKARKEKKEKKEKKKRDREAAASGGGGSETPTEAERHAANKRPKKADEGGGGEEKGEKGKPHEITTLFFGQMPYDTKVEHIVPWLKTILRREGCANDVHAVRLAGGGATNKKFKGFAFVDFKTRKAAKKCRKFHDTLFRGRKVSIEPCSRPEYVEPKSQRRARERDAADAPEGDTSGARNEKKQLKQLVDSDTVDEMVAEKCASANGLISESDFDAQMRSFLSLLPRDVLAAALRAIEKQAPKAPKRKIPYFMGIIKKVSKQHWDKSEAKKKRDAGQLAPEPKEAGKGKTEGGAGEGGSGEKEKEAGEGDA